MAVNHGFRQISYRMRSDMLYKYDLVEDEQHITISCPAYIHVWMIVERYFWKRLARGKVV